MRDISFLPGRKKTDADFNALDHTRLTLKMLCRDEFKKMDKYEQEVYLYRLSRYCSTPFILSDFYLFMLKEAEPR